MTGPEPTEGLVDGLPRWPYSPNQVRDYLHTLPQTVDRDALIATLAALGHDNLFQWGPRPGSKAEGEYERAHKAFYALERALRPAMFAAGVEQ